MKLHEFRSGMAAELLQDFPETSYGPSYFKKGQRVIITEGPDWANHISSQTKVFLEEVIVLIRAEDPSLTKTLKCYLRRLKVADPKQLCLDFGDESTNV